MCGQPAYNVCRCLRAMYCSTRCQVSCCSSLLKHRNFATVFFLAVQRLDISSANMRVRLHKLLCVLVCLDSVILLFRLRFKKILRVQSDYRISLRQCHNTVCINKLPICLFYSRIRNNLYCLLLLLNRYFVS